MQPSLGHKILTKHGLIDNVLTPLPFEAQLTLAKVIRRTYEITVPFNVPSVKIKVKETNLFPKIDEVTADCLCTVIGDAVVEG